MADPEGQNWLMTSFNTFYSAISYRCNKELQQMSVVGNVSLFAVLGMKSSCASCLHSLLSIGE
jgi:hypothetical protein